MKTNHKKKTLTFGNAAVSVRKLSEVRKPCQVHEAAGFQESCAWCRAKVG
jgi:hypothetical protein